MAVPMAMSFHPTAVQAMRSRLNLSHVFHRNGSTNTLLTSLRPADLMMAEINAAENTIRRELGQFLDSHLKSVMPRGVSPPKAKFRRQGSNAYGTLIDPLRSSQHYADADSDVGLYLPLEFVKEGTPNPQVGARALRELTFAGLNEIAAKRPGWSVVQKTCCDRVVIRPDAYIDVTSYAISAEQYRRMAEELAELNFHESLAKSDSAALESREITWEEIPETSLLATQSEWIRSDAKSIHKHVENNSRLLGPVYKRSVRFGKALRDFHDDEDGPNSITLTLLFARHLDLNLCRMERDDLALAAVLGPVAEGLFEFLPTPGNPDIDILAGIDDGVKLRLAAMLRERQAVISNAMNASSFEVAHDMLREIFGTRFPEATDEEKARDSMAGGASPVILTPTKVKPVQPRGNARSA